MGPQLGSQGETCEGTADERGKRSSAVLIAKRQQLSDAEQGAAKRMEGMTPTSMVALIHAAKKAHGRTLRQAEAVAAATQGPVETQVA